MDNTENISPSFYANITANVRYDKNLPANAKLLYAEITALTNKFGYCFASNNYFARLYEVTPQAISKWVNILSDNGYINIEYIRDGKEIKERHIYISGSKPSKVSTDIEGVSTNDLGGINKGLIGYQQMIKDNITHNTKRNIKPNNISEVELLKQKLLEAENKIAELSEAKASEKKVKKTKKDDYTPLLTSDFYKTVFSEYKKVFFGLNNGGIPNARNYKQQTDTAITRLRTFGLTDEVICSKILEAIKNAPCSAYWRNEAHGSFAYIVSETGLNNLTGRRTNVNKGSAFEKAGGFENVDYAQGF